MKNSKVRKYFGRGRKWFFTHASKSHDVKGWLLKRGTALALFLLVFAAASVVKVQAASIIKGWLWGGSEDANIGGSLGTWPPDGNETGVGWVSMNNTNVGAGGSHAYNVVINDDNTVSGYAWANAGGNPDNGQQNGLGWIQFNPVPDNVKYPGCGYPSSPCHSVKRSGNDLIGWARFAGIANEYAAGNSGGWEGWLKMHNVTIDPGTGKLNGYGWNGEDPGTGGNMANGLGWINFDKATIEEVCTLEFVPASKTMNENSSVQVLLQEVSTGSNCNCGSVTLTKNSAIVSLLSPAGPLDFSSSTKQGENITVNTGSVASTTTVNPAVTATSANCGPASLELVVQNIPSCVISAPDSVTVSSNSYVDYDVTVTGGDPECSTAPLDCSKTSGDSNISVANTPGETRKCRVTETAGERYGSAVSHAQIGGGVDSGKDTDVNVKGAGWVETAP